MKKVIFLICILTLAACSEKKPKPVRSGPRPAVSSAVAEVQKDSSPAVRPDFDEDGYTHRPLFYLEHLDVQASAELSDYPASNLIDATWQSWAVRGGPGESFTLALSEELTEESASYYSSRQTMISGFALKNGYGDLDYYTANNRVKSFSIYVNENFIETIIVKDSISFEQYYFEEPFEMGSIRFVIDEVYPGTIYNETCIAEIALLEHWVSDRRFYDNILFWLGPDELGDTQYESNRRDIVSVPDADSLILRHYFPYDVPGYDDYYYDWRGRRHEVKTKIAFLDGESSLKLNDDLPRLDGATAMYPLYSSFVRAVYPQITIENGSLDSLLTWAYFPSKNLVYDWLSAIGQEDRELTSIVQCNTTSEAYQRLIDGEVDIIFCYEPSRAETSAAAEKGLQFKLTPIARDAFVFIVNNKNILNNITENQIRDIYAGRVTNWKTINGADEPLIAYQRRENSGSQTTLQSIMGEEKIIRPILDGERVRYDMYSMIQSVASDYYNYNSAIGYSFLFYLTHMTGDLGITVLTVDGIAPTRQTIQNNTYPFVQTVYAITTGNESENTRKFIEWILSAQGQELVAKTGYTPVR